MKHLFTVLSFILVFTFLNPVVAYTDQTEEVKKEEVKKAKLDYVRNLIKRQGKAAEEKSESFRMDISRVWFGNFQLPVPYSESGMYRLIGLDNPWQDVQCGMITLDLLSDVKRVTMGNNYYIVQLALFADDILTVIVEGQPGLGSDEIILFQFMKKMTTSESFRLAFIVGNGYESTGVSYCGFIKELDEY